MKLNRPSLVVMLFFTFLVTNSSFDPSQLLALEPIYFVKQHCADCHSGDDPEGRFNLDALTSDLKGKPTFESWVKIYDKVQRSEMPPSGADQPESKQKLAFLKKLQDSLNKVDVERQQLNGRVVLRRLNRVEYENTLRDLLELPGLEIKEMLPPDAEAHGFDNVSEALRVSYVQMARYLKASRAALNQAAWLAPKIEPYDFRIPFPEIHRFKITKDRVTIGKEAILLRQPNTAQTPWRLESIQLPFAGIHTIRIHGRGVTFDQSNHEDLDTVKLLPPEYPQIVSVYQGTRIIGSFELGEKSKTFELTGWFHPQETIYLYIPTLEDWGPTWTKKAYRGPAVALEWIEVKGPVDAQFPTASYQRLFKNLPVTEWKQDSGLLPPPEIGFIKHTKNYPKLDMPKHQTRFMVVSKSPETDAKRLLLDFMQRAIRRPISASEVEPYFQIVKAQLEKKHTFQEAMIAGYAGILISPDFLYFSESSGKLDAYALASRLSYFLWRSMPDQELWDVAVSGELNQRDVLKKQIARMMKDPKRTRFIEDFCGQWLDLHEIQTTRPDQQLYPEFDDFMLESMVAETHAFVKELMDANLPARTLIDADFVFANNTLSELYQLPKMNGVTLHKIKLPANNPRGGLLTQASILKVTANGTTTSPVVRGAWVLDRILGMPAPPPPPDVPAVEPDTRGATTIRELLAKHRADQACSVCHQKIDPPGFALESFDVIGGWRDQYRSLENGTKVNKKVDSIKVRYKMGLPVDSTGTTADGKPFDDIYGFKQLLLEDERQIARNLTKRLVIFATGAPITFADRAQIEAILDRTQQSDYAVGDLIQEVILSDLFQNK